jgi:short-subunit dehydrogenase
MKDLKDQVAFVTGGSSGIGLGIVKALAAEGMRVAFSYRSDAHLRDTMAYFRDKPEQRVHPVKLDVTDRPGVAAAKLDIERTLGPVRVLVNNAGVGMFGLVENASFSDWDWLMSVNVGGVVNCLVTFLPDMVASGEAAHIVNVASIGGVAALGTAGLYATTKFAVVGLSEALRTDMVGRNVGISVYCPGTVKSNIGDSDSRRQEKYKDSGYTPPAAPSAQESNFMDLAMDADEAARHVIQGIKDNQLYILSHPEFRDVLEARHAKIEAAITQEPVDAVRAQSVSFLLSNPIYSGNA